MLFLASPASAYVTGAVIAVDGGHARRRDLIRRRSLAMTAGRHWRAFSPRRAGRGRVEITELDAARGGAIQENWGIDARFSGGRLAGEQRLVLRAAAATGIPSSLGRIEEFAVLQAAFAAGVTVPEPLFACADPAVFGKPFFVMRRASRDRRRARITRDPALDPVLPAIAARLGHELARIHTIRPPRPDLGFSGRIKRPGQRNRSPGSAAYLDTNPQPRPVLEWGIRWLETHLPAPVPPVLCHHDFRTGNYMLDGARLTGILDWEFAGWGDPDEDIGWFCCKGWRFARLDREAGGIADRAPFYRGYGKRGPPPRPAAGAFLGGAGQRALGGDCLAAERPPHAGRRTQPRSGA